MNNLLKKFQNTLANISKKNQDIPNNTVRTNNVRVDRNIKNLSTVTNLAKSKKLDLTKSKKSDLPKANFAKINFEIDFLISEAKKIFIYLQKAFTKALILRHFDSKCYISINANALGYVIDRILN